MTEAALDQLLSYLRDRAGECASDVEIKGQADGAVRIESVAQGGAYAFFGPKSGSDDAASALLAATTCRTPGGEELVLPGPTVLRLLLQVGWGFEQARAAADPAAALGALRAARRRKKPNPDWWLLHMQEVGAVGRNGQPMWSFLGDRVWDTARESLGLALEPLEGLAAALLGEAPAAEAQTPTTPKAAKGKAGKDKAARSQAAAEGPPAAAATPRTDGVFSARLQGAERWTLWMAPNAAALRCLREGVYGPIHRFEEDGRWLQSSVERLLPAGAEAVEVSGGTEGLVPRPLPMHLALPGPPAGLNLSGQELGDAERSGWWREVHAASAPTQLRHLPQILDLSPRLASLQVGPTGSVLLGDRSLAALSAEGELQWVSHATTGDITLCNAALVADQLLFTIGDTTLSAFDAVDGTFRWTVKSRGRIEPFIHGGLLFVVQTPTGKPDTLRWFHPGTGKKLGNLTLPLHGQVEAPVVSQGLLLLNSYAGASRSLCVVDLQSRTVLRNASLHRYDYGLTAVDGVIYQPTQEGDPNSRTAEGLQACDARSGDLRWRVEDRIDRGRTTHNLTIADGLLFYLTVDKELVCRDADSGALRWRRPNPDGGSLRAVGSVLLRGQLEALDAATGEPRWRLIEGEGLLTGVATRFGLGIYAVNRHGLWFSDKADGFYRLSWEV